MINDDSKVKKASIESSGDPFLKAGTIIVEDPVKLLFVVLEKTVQEELRMKNYQLILTQLFKIN